MSRTSDPREAWIRWVPEADATGDLNGDLQFLQQLVDQFPIAVVAVCSGIEVDNVRHDWARVIERSRRVSSNLNKGVHALFKKNQITHVQGRAKIAAPGRVQVGEQALGLVTLDGVDPAFAGHTVFAGQVTDC